MKTDIVAAFSSGLIFGGRKCLHATSQKRALARNFVSGEFAHSDVSYRFNGRVRIAYNADICDHK